MSQEFVLQIEKKIFLQASLKLEENEEAARPEQEESLYMFEGTDYSKTSKADDEAFDALIVCKLPV